MSEADNSYDALDVEDNWIEYLRRRLPYSFLKIHREQKRLGRRRHGHRFILSEPRPHVGAEYHNFWRRGYAYYVAGKLMDTHNQSRLWIEYRRLLAERMLHAGRTIPAAWTLMTARHNYNAMQMEKLWAPVERNHLDRERVAMTNMCQAVELCLKAVKAHAEYRERGEFTFDEDHNLKRIHESLPPALKREIRAESRRFAKQYAAFRRDVEETVERWESIWRLGLDWERIGGRIESNTYTAILGANDPTSRSENWFDEAMRLVGERDITYHRYSPVEGCDEYPVDPIHAGLTLGRFLYEHLFPVQSTAQEKSLARFMVVDGWVLEQPGRPVGSFVPRRR